MTAFDGDSLQVNVYFDSPGDEIEISLTDDPDFRISDEVIAVSPWAIPEIVEDLVTAFYIRTGELCPVPEYLTTPFLEDE